MRAFAGIAATLILAACASSPPPPAPPAPTPVPAAAPAQPAVACSRDGAARPPALAAVALRGTRDAAVCELLRSRAGAPLDEAAVESDIRALHAGGLVEDVVAVLEVVEDGAGAAPTLFFEVKERPRLLAAGVSSAPEGVDTTRAIGEVPRHLDPTWVRGAQSRLVDALRWEGYRKATVDYVVTPAGSGGVEVGFVVKPERRFSLGAIRFEGLANAPEARLREGLGLRVGSPAAEPLIERDTHVVTSALYDLGMVESNVVARVEENFLAASYDVVFTVKEGAIYRLGDVKVAGTHALPPARYAAILKKLPRGKAFARSAVAACIQEIESLHREVGPPRAVQVESQLDPKKRVVSLVLLVE